MSIKVTNDANNGTVTIKGAEVAGDYTVTTPAFATELAPRMQLMTAQNSTSGTSIDFTGIPSWAKKITVMFNGVSTNGTSPVQVQVGSASIQSTGYIGVSCSTIGAGVTSFTSGMGVNISSVASNTYSGVLNILNISGFSWSASSVVNNVNAASGGYIGTSGVTLSSTLDRIRVTTVNGTDTFDAGQINVLYEG